MEEMKSQSPTLSTLSKAFATLHSALIFVTAGFLFYTFLFIITFPFRAYLSTEFQIPIFIITLIKLLFYSGAYGTLTDLASDKIITPSFNNFIENVKKYWWLCFLLTVLHSTLLLIEITVLNRFFNTILLFKYFHFNILILYLFAIILVFEKFIKPFHLSGRKITLKPIQIFTIACLYILDAAAINYLLLMPPNLQRLIYPAIISTYTNLLIFCYFITIILESYPEIEAAHNKDKNFYLINPVHGGIFTGLVSGWNRNYPAFFVVLKAFTPKHYKTKEFIRVPWKNKFYKKNKLVAISCYTSNCAEAYKIAKEFKKKGSTVIMGGHHVTRLPDEALQFCDAVVIGEAEAVWKEVISDYENKSLKKKYFGEALNNFYDKTNEILLNSPSFITKSCLETTRGCKFNCYFCALFKNKIRHKPIPQIIELVKKIKKDYKAVGLMDDNIYADPEYAKKLFKALIPLKIKWGTQSSIDIAEDDEALKLAKESGCAQFLFGYEISGTSLEKNRGGKFALAEKYIQLTKKTKKAGIPIKAHFIFGFDSDNLRTIFPLWKFCFLLMPRLTVFSLLTPLPGTACFSDMVKTNRITNYNWRNYNFHRVVFKHKSMSPLTFQISFYFLQYFYLFTTSHFGYFLIFLYVLLQILF